jgi:REP element-mobilizing transposase RayT
MQKDWPHAPLHRLDEGGVYMVTSGTLRKQHLFGGPEGLDLLESALLRLARHYGWQLEAWAMFSNHYHFIGRPDGAAREVNRLDEQQGRQVWHNYWESHLTFERLVSRATQLRASKRGTSWSGGCGQSVCMVFGRVVRAGGGAGDGEDRLRVQDRSD